MKADYERISEFLDCTIRHQIQGDGGDFEVISIDNQGLNLALIGECSRCPITDSCYKGWLKQRIKEKLTIDININTKQKKPYFWD